MKPIALTFAAAALGAAPALVAGTHAAQAHAFLSHASPAVGSTVKESPPALELWYTEEVEPAFCKVELLDGAGKRVDHGGLKAAPGDKAELILPVPHLAPGTYKVVWHAVSVDTHRTQGDFTFTVAP
ncbi:MAG TPA: copper resistance protein CopC [Alphaproteobacteria bacterium]|nr:copper resistance protein CopC [Alphaproteobacteria bacterium]